MSLSNEETEKFYQDLFSLTSRPEWSIFTDYCKDLLKNKIEGALDIETIEELNRQKGQADVLKMVISFRNVIETQYQFLKDDQDEYETI